MNTINPITQVLDHLNITDRLAREKLADLDDSYENIAQIKLWKMILNDISNTKLSLRVLESVLGNKGKWITQ